LFALLIPAAWLLTFAGSNALMLVPLMTSVTNLCANSRLPHGTAG
jgi:hypothetical protein